MVLIFAFLGLLFGGARGLLIGTVIGLVLSALTKSAVKRGVGRVQDQFIDSTFAVVGALCKADGVVTRNEIQFTETLFERFHLTEDQRTRAKEAFRRGKAPGFDLDAEVDAFALAARGNHALFQMFLRVQLMAVVADGQVHPGEREMLLHIARRLRLSPLEIAQIEAVLHVAASGGPQTSSSSDRTRTSAPPSTHTLDGAYRTLGVDGTASDAEIKRAYRNLIRENHPDRLASKGLPENMRELAEERTREINAAYDVIKRARGLS